MPNTTNEWEEKLYEKIGERYPLERDGLFELIDTISPIISKLLTSERAKLIKEIEEKIEIPESWKEAVKSYDPNTKGEYCACCGFRPEQFQSLLNSLK